MCSGLVDSNHLDVPIMHAEANFENSGYGGGVIGVVQHSKT